MFDRREALWWCWSHVFEGSPCGKSYILLGRDHHPWSPLENSYSLLHASRCLYSTPPPLLWPSDWRSVRLTPTHRLTRFPCMSLGAYSRGLFRIHAHANGRCRHFRLTRIVFLSTIFIAQVKPWIHSITIDLFNTWSSSSVLSRFLQYSACIIVMPHKKVVELCIANLELHSADSRTVER